jgi:DNA-binding protein YbaB
LHPTTKESNNAAINKVYDDYEEKVRRKALILVKKKIEKRLKDVEIDDEALAQLEKELLEDLEQTIQENIEEYRKKPHSIP